MKLLAVACVVSCVAVVARAQNAPEPKFRAETIDDKIEIGYGVTTGDVDGDGKLDILLADKRQFAWYRNPTWEKFILAENLTERDNVCIAAQDIDGDGKCEIAVGGDWASNDRENSGAVFYLIAPDDRTQKWEPVKLHAEPTVHRMRWMKLKAGGWGLVVAPLHGRGKDSNAPSRILLYHPPADMRGEWRTQIIDATMHATHNFDVQGTSLLIAGREGVLRLEQVDDGTFSTTPLPSVQSSGEVASTAAWIATIEPMHGETLALYFGGKRCVLTDAMTEGHALRVDNLAWWAGPAIIVGWRGKGGGVRAFTPLDGDLANWRETVVDDGGMACEDLCLADLNGDKKLDIIASGRATKNVKIYWNETPNEPAGKIAH